ncbi:MAG: DUF2807 domain-containing protein [Candidatus Marinimicrobia bacterium]|nr:DUF2807 domain-containing protein [Candidatus Neomarinimicrobiota bacterium]
MKKSKKLIIFVLSIPFIIVLIIVLYLRIVLDSGLTMSAKEYGQYGDEIVIEDLPLADFTNLKFRGAWHIAIEQGSEYKVRIEGPEYLVKRIRINQTGQDLYLRENRLHRSGGSKLEAEITLPLLEKLAATGNSRIYISDFDCENLILDFKGSGRVIGENNVIENLELECDGSVDVDFSGSNISNAVVDLVGSSKTELTMTGGELTGSLTGSASVVYSGDVATQSISTYGGSSVRKK